MKLEGNTNESSVIYEKQDCNMSNTCSIGVVQTDNRVVNSRSVRDKHYFSFMPFSPQFEEEQEKHICWGHPLEHEFLRIIK